MRRRQASLACAFLFLLIPSVRAEDAADARAVIDKAIEAAGGRAALAKYEKPFVMEIKTKSSTPRAVAENTARETRWFPDRFRDESPGRMGQGNYVMLFNGTSGKYTGFSTGKGMTVNSFDQSQIEQARDTVYCERLTTLLPLDEAGFRLTMLDEVVLDGRPSVGVKISHAERPDVQLYFDKETFVLTKQVRPWRQPGGNRSFTFLYDDYVETDGLVYPRKATGYLDDAKSFESEIRELKFLDKVDEKLFEEP